VPEKVQVNDTHSRAGKLAHQASTEQQRKARNSNASHLAVLIFQL